MENDIRERVRDHIIRRGMIHKGDKVCVAVSGGADSMCLLFLLKELCDSMDFSLSAVHVEHGIRGQESLGDMKFVSSQCESLNILLTVVRIDAVSLAENTGTTLEEAARNERYRIFSETEADRIALAHHMNDQAETFIFNSIRGSGIRGLKGMDGVRGKYIRPLLFVTREEIETYCREKHIRYRLDSTNNDTAFSRNRIRHEVMPALLGINTGAVRHICETMEEISGVEDYLARETEIAYNDCVYAEPLGMSIDIDKLEELHDAIASRVIKTVLVRKAGREKDIGRRHIDAVRMLAKGQSGRHIDLIYGIKVRKEFRKLIIRGPGEYELHMTVPETQYTVLLKKYVPMEQIISSGTYTKYIDYAKIDDVSFLSLRHRKQGDYISIKGGNKKLKDLLIEEKIPVGKRDGMFFIAMGSEIIWIPELGRIGERLKVTADTEKILKMEIKNG